MDFRVRSFAWGAIGVEESSEEVTGCCVSTIGTVREVPLEVSVSCSRVSRGRSRFECGDLCRSKALF
jgi:hypothetical protein